MKKMSTSIATTILQEGGISENSLISTAIIMISNCHKNVWKQTKDIYKQILLEHDMINPNSNYWNWYLLYYENFMIV